MTTRLAAFEPLPFGVGKLDCACAGLPNIAKSSAAARARKDRTDKVIVVKLRDEKLRDNKTDRKHCEYGDAII
jgi:hypothetical protein